VQSQPLASRLGSQAVSGIYRSIILILRLHQGYGGPTGSYQYKEAEGILGYTQGALRNMKSLSDQIELSWRHDKLSWQHHCEVASLRLIERSKDLDYPQSACPPQSTCT